MNYLNFCVLFLGFYIFEIDSIHWVPMKIRFWVKEIDSDINSILCSLSYLTLLDYPLLFNNLIFGLGFRKAYYLRTIQKNKRFVKFVKSKFKAKKKKKEIKIIEILDSTFSTNWFKNTFTVKSFVKIFNQREKYSSWVLKSALYKFALVWYIF